jgi:hypothetical protein
MSNDKLSNEEYFKAKAADIVKLDTLSPASRKAVIQLLYDLHNEVKDRIDQSGPLPFGKVKEACTSCAFLAKNNKATYKHETYYCHDRNVYVLDTKNHVCDDYESKTIL